MFTESRFFRFNIKTSNFHQYTVFSPGRKLQGSFMTSTYLTCINKGLRIGNQIYIFFYDSELQSWPSLLELPGYGVQPETKEDLVTLDDNKLIKDHFAKSCAGGKGGHKLSLLKWMSSQSYTSINALVAPVRANNIRELSFTVIFHSCHERLAFNKYCTS